MNKKLCVLLFTILFTSACGPGNPAPPVNLDIIQTAIVNTAVAAQNQTQAANPATDLPLPTETLLPTNPPPAATETPSGPLSLVYEGLTINCSCINCFCVTNVVITVRVTIDPSGNITGVLEQYLPETTAMTLGGTKDNILGSSQYGTAKDASSFDFIGSINENLSQLTATISFAGKAEDGSLYSGKRELLLFKK